jgi:hypothetical protein
MISHARINYRTRIFRHQDLEQYLQRRTILAPLLTETSVQANIFTMSITPQALLDLLDELEASRASRKRAWENLQEIRWVLKDAAEIDLPPAPKKTIDLEGRVVKDGVRKAITDRQIALTDLVHAIGEYRKLAESKPLTLQGSDYAQAVQALNKAIDRAEDLLQG